MDLGLIYILLHVHVFPFGLLRKFRRKDAPANARLAIEVESSLLELRVV